MKVKRLLAGMLACATVFSAAMPTVSADDALSPTRMGDVNVDNAVDISDVIMLARYAAEDTTVSVTKQGLANADLNEDGKFTSADVTKILRIIAKLETAPVKAGSRDLMAGIAADLANSKNADEAFEIAQTKFSLDLLQQAAKGNDGSKGKQKNILVSPLSAVMALGMTANGASDETLAGMEQALGGLSIDDLNRYLYTQKKDVAKSDELSLANAIWFRDDGTMPLPSIDFLQKNATFYDAGAYASPFDESVKDEINDYVKEHTKGMIPKILEQPPSLSTSMYLVNTLAFESDWFAPFNADSIGEKDFTAYDGSKTEVQMMYGSSVYYLEDENAMGFVKSYKNDKYAFVAMLPNEGVDIYDYVAGLEAESFHKMLASGTAERVPYTWHISYSIPEFTYDYSYTMNDALKEMGMEKAFDGYNAEFGNMYDGAQAGDFYIGNVLQKTHIDVTPKGTRAAAATIVEMQAGAAMPEVNKDIYLDRPFVYMILDMDTDLPVFIGMVTDMNGCENPQM